MTDQFHVFAAAVRSRFADMSARAAQLFCVAIPGDVLWDCYLGAFPDGANPVYRERREHDCSCCRHFIRQYAGVVAIENGALSSIWDVTALPAPYDVVAAKMSAIVRAARSGEHLRYSSRRPARGNRLRVGRAPVCRDRRPARPARARGGGASRDLLFRDDQVGGAAPPPVC